MLTVRKMRVSVASVGKNILVAFGLAFQPLETAARRVGVFAHVVPAIYVSVLGDVGGDREATRVVGRVLSDDFEDGTFHVIDHDCIFRQGQFISKSTRCADMIRASFLPQTLRYWINVPPLKPSSSVST